MFRPALKPIRQGRDETLDFKGYNHNLVQDSNEFYDMQNVSCDNYPLLTQRNKRGFISTIPEAHGLCSKEKLIWVSHNRLYYNGNDVMEVSESEKQFVSMGAYLLIFPDKKFYNTVTEETGNLEHSFETQSQVTFSLCMNDDYNYVTGSEPPGEPTNDTIWLDTSTTPNVLKQYSTYNEQWIPIPTSYIKIAANGIGAGFKKLDGVFISGCAKEQYNSSFIVENVTDDSVVIKGLIDASFSQEEPLKVERKVPDMDFVCEMQNRVWGCSSDHREIYCSKQGDPFNWYTYEGLSTDSYAATIGSNGRFTGCISYMGSVLFFKEDMLHKVQGTKPANFQIMQHPVRGVQAGSERSLSIVNEVLYYKSRNGICQYDGSLPFCISDKLGSDNHYKAVAGSLNNKYYVSMCDSNNAYTLFSFDTSKGVWVKEDNTQAKYFATHDNELYFIDHENRLNSINGSLGINLNAPAFCEESLIEDDVQWFVETGDLYLYNLNQKYISKLLVRMDVEVDSSVQILMKFDNSEWVEKCSYTSNTMKSFAIPIIPQRCDHLSLKIQGTGKATIYAISKAYEQGSEIDNELGYSKPTVSESQQF